MPLVLPIMVKEGAKLTLSALAIEVSDYVKSKIWDSVTESVKSYGNNLSLSENATARLSYSAGENIGPFIDSITTFVAGLDFTGAILPSADEINEALVLSISRLVAASLFSELDEAAATDLMSRKFILGQTKGVKVAFERDLTATDIDRILMSSSMLEAMAQLPAASSITDGKLNIGPPKDFLSAQFSGKSIRPDSAINVLARHLRVDAPVAGLSGVLSAMSGAEVSSSEDTMMPTSIVIDPDDLKEISSQFGYRTHPISKDVSFHYGLDLAADQGSEILAGHKCEVVFVSKKETASLGNFVVVRATSPVFEANGVKVFVQTVYGHMFNHLGGKDGQFKVGSIIDSDQVIGTVGSTGGSTGNHLHIGCYLVNGDKPKQHFTSNAASGVVYFDPEPFLFGQELSARIRVLAPALLKESGSASLAISELDTQSVSTTTASAFNYTDIDLSVFGTCVVATIHSHDRSEAFQYAFVSSSRDQVKVIFFHREVQFAAISFPINQGLILLHALEEKGAMIESLPFSDELLESPVELLVSKQLQSASDAISLHRMFKMDAASRSPLLGEDDLCLEFSRAFGLTEEDFDEMGMTVDAVNGNGHKGFFLPLLTIGHNKQGVLTLEVGMDERDSLESLAATFAQKQFFDENDERSSRQVVHFGEIDVPVTLIRVIECDDMRLVEDLDGWTLNLDSLNKSLSNYITEETLI